MCPDSRVDIKRFSTRGMLVTVSLVAMCCASMLYPSATWVTMLRFLVAVLFLVSVLGVVYRRGERQAFWLGFALFGISWGIAAWQFSKSIDVSTVLNALNSDIVPQDRWEGMQVEIDGLDERLRGFESSYTDPRNSKAYINIQKQSVVKQKQLSDSVALAETADIMSTLSMAFLGSLISCHFWRTREAE